MVTVRLRVQAASGTLNGRHEFVAALLVIAVTVRSCRRWERAVATVLCAVGWVVVLGALSRAVLLAVLVPAVAPAGPGTAASSRRRKVLATTAAALAVGAVAAWRLPDHRRGYLDLAEWAAFGLVVALGLTARRAVAD